MRYKIYFLAILINYHLWYKQKPNNKKHIIITKRTTEITSKHFFTRGETHAESCSERKKRKRSWTAKARSLLLKFESTAGETNENGMRVSQI